MTKIPTPEDVLAYWIGDTRHSAENLKEKHKLWFGKSGETDAEIRDRFLGLLDDASHMPFADDWAAEGPRGRLAAIIVLDQFSRNLFRGDARAFHQDSLALRMCKDGLALNEHKSLSETERVFLCLEFKDFAKSTLDFAHQHLKVIQDFGRFPHRNKALGRETTAEEAEWLAEGGGF